MRKNVVSFTRALLIIGFFLVTLSVVPQTFAESAEVENLVESFQEVTITSLTIKIYDAKSKALYWENIARKIIAIKTGEKISYQALTDAIVALTISRQFSKVTIKDRYTGDEGGEDQLALHFDLTVFRRIKKIDIAGNYPFFEKDIHKAMTVRVGDPFTSSLVQDQRELIMKLYRKDGFYASKVTIIALIDQKDDQYELSIHIDRGPHYWIKEVRIKGNKAFKEKKLLRLMKTWKKSFLPKTASRYSEEVFHKDIERIKSFYFKKRFCDMTVDYYSPYMDSAQGFITVDIRISEGLPYHITFNGNKVISARRLKKELVLFEKGQSSTSGIRKSIKNIRTLYHERGYVHAKVRRKDLGVIDRKGKKENHVEISISEGVKCRLDKILISGATHIDKDILLKKLGGNKENTQKKRIFSEENILEGIYSIKSLYLENGFQDPHVESNITFNEDKTFATVELIFNEGKKTTIESVTFKGMDAFLSSKVIEGLALKKGKPYRPYMLKSDENYLANMIAEKGYPYVTVVGETIHDAIKHQVVISYTVDVGPRVKIGVISYSGNFRTKEKVISQNFPLKKGDLFSLKAYLIAQQKLRKLNIFQSVRFRVIGLKEKKETVHIFIEMEEKKPYFFNAGGGFETDRGFYAESEMGDHNFWGSNKDIWVGGAISDIETETYAGVYEPSLFGSQISTKTELSLKREKPLNQPTGREIISGKLNFVRPLSTHWTGALAMGYERRDQFLRSIAGEDHGIEEQELLPRGIFVTTPQLTYDLRDSFIRPSKGVYSNLSVEISKGIENALDDFVKLRWDGRLYYTPLSHFTLALLTRAGYIEPYGKAIDVPIDQLFFLGGTRSVRGFEENLLQFELDDKGKQKGVGGHSILLGSLEARIDLGWNLEFTMFFDSGSVQDVPDLLLDKSFRSSIGIGLSYHTPIGPIGLFYGIKLDPRPDEESGRLHFSVGYTF